MDNILYNLVPAVGFVTLVVFLIFLVLSNAAISGDVFALKRQAIERGYALYCPADGEFAWKGECEQKGEE